MKKTAMIDYVKRERVDEYKTPPSAIKPLLKYIPQEVKTIWEPTDCEHGSGIREFFSSQSGYRLISTCEDFLSFSPDFDFDGIVTNPPYSLKDEFLERAYSFNKFFAFLLPITTLEGVFRGSLFQRYGINLIVFDRRVQFMSNKRGVWFSVGWFFYVPGGENNRLYFESLPLDRGS